MEHQVCWCALGFVREAKADLIVVVSEREKLLCVLQAWLVISLCDAFSGILI